MIMIVRRHKMNQQTLDVLKIATNILLAVILIAVLVLTILYKADVQEAIGVKEPDRLMKLYEDKTDTTCLCANPELGSVVFVPTKLT
jgi:hypothetical protein